ncbi:hypothetical protein MSG28_013170 [Choristoneura fumiferana]|uniref:Uncharacterized protein n=1 Tax=Choristoneura fumiferana TaxID=7141 RepID=A0ACC0KRV3_CHOFU|nr:hypothetical protein MSG28_013170 [Choristoneura fumiferana]
MNDSIKETESKSGLGGLDIEAGFSESEHFSEPESRLPISPLAKNSFINRLWELSNVLEYLSTRTKFHSNSFSLISNYLHTKFQPNRFSGLNEKIFEETQSARAPRTKGLDAERYKIIFGTETTVFSCFGSYYPMIFIQSEQLFIPSAIHEDADIIAAMQRARAIPNRFLNTVAHRWDSPGFLILASLKRRKTTPSGQKSECRNICWCLAGTWRIKHWLSHAAACRVAEEALEDIVVPTVTDIIPSLTDFTLPTIDFTLPDISFSFTESPDDS